MCLEALKGSVQRKLRGVENSGAGHYFFVLVRLYLVLII
jgi:hypothetical protein